MSRSALDLEVIFSDRIRALADDAMQDAHDRCLRLGTAESCTGGLLATLLTDLPGVSHCFECGFVVYSDEAKTRLLGIPGDVIAAHGAVSERVAREMAERARDRGDAHIAISITGFAGPAGEDDEEGLVYIASARAGGLTDVQEHHFGPLGRDAVRARALEAALLLLRSGIRAL
jgi:nicotinamide-nucleotide amidase